jgi:Methyltransferase domain
MHPVWRGLADAYLVADPRCVVLACVVREALIGEYLERPLRLAGDREGRRAVPSGQLARESLDRLTSCSQVRGELARRLSVNRLVLISVAADLVPVSGDLLDQVGVRPGRHSEDEERRPGGQPIEQLEQRCRLTAKRGSRDLPAGHSDASSDELVPVLEVDAEQQRPTTIIARRVVRGHVPPRYGSERYVVMISAMHGDRSPAGGLYDEIGAAYGSRRRTEPRIAARIWSALGDARTVLNVGAGTGSYEPADRDVTAVEPSAVMRAGRPAGAAPCIAAAAEALPFPDRSFDAAMAVLSDHHWQDPTAGLLEMRRVARRVVVFQWDDSCFGCFWLVRDYLPEFNELGSRGPTLAERAAAIDAAMEPVPIPWDCLDGFFHSYWRRPHAYLREEVRRGTSVWSSIGADVESRAVSALAEDLVSGLWYERNQDLLVLEEAELGARILVAD